ncbi:MAG: hypothetical protein GY801_39685 [bacterium]|nr:hypothetical protein [bacterium]
MYQTQEEITDEHYRLIKAIHENKKRFSPQRIAELQMLLCFAQYIEVVHLQTGELPTFEYARSELSKSGITV